MVGKAGSGGRPIARGFDRAALRQLRTNAGMRQEDLAAAAGVQRTQIARFETENGPVPVVRTLRALASALGVTPTELLSIPPGEIQLADLRYLAGLTQHQLAAAIDVPRSTYSALERGALRLSDTWAASLAAALETTVSAVSDAYSNTSTHRGDQP